MKQSRILKNCKMSERSIERVKNVLSPLLSKGQEAKQKANINRRKSRLFLRKLYFIIEKDLDFSMCFTYLCVLKIVIVIYFIFIFVKRTYVLSKFKSAEIVILEICKKMQTCESS